VIDTHDEGSQTDFQGFPLTCLSLKPGGNLDQAGNAACCNLAGLFLEDVQACCTPHCNISRSIPDAERARILRPNLPGSILHFSVDPFVFNALFWKETGVRLIPKIT
jgi:hypothetical protein